MKYSLLVFSKVKRHPEMYCSASTVKLLVRTVPYRTVALRGFILWYGNLTHSFIRCCIDMTPYSLILNPSNLTSPIDYFLSNQHLVTSRKIGDSCDFIVSTQGVHKKFTIQLKPVSRLMPLGMNDGS